jgi:endogenous inhibitor of DNA gyrase (YacG/DUF329 family)
MPTCPTCKTPVAADAETFPFCQARCKLLDLGNWLTGRYVVSSPVSLDESEIAPTRFSGNELEAVMDERLEAELIKAAQAEISPEDLAALRARTTKDAS